MKTDHLKLTILALLTIICMSARSQDACYYYYDENTALTLDTMMICLIFGPAITDPEGNFLRNECIAFPTHI